MKKTFQKIRKRKYDPLTDNQSERVIFEMFYHRVFETAYFILQDRHLAQDVVQETFLKAFQNIHKVQDGAKLGSWLGTIAARTAIDVLRKEKKYRFAVENMVVNEPHCGFEYSAVEKIIEERFLKNLVRQQIAGLKPEYRQVIVLKYEYELQDHEIAEALDLSVSAVKSRLHRAKLALKRILEKYQYDVKDVINHD
jgi:RNA polymerase sigma-70 factor (ECF subfamily)